MKVLLTCFQYTDENKLPIQGDINIVFSYFKKLTNDITVFTDIRKKEFVKITSSDTYRNYITNLISNKIIFYYTGHSDGGRMIFPDGSYISFEEIKDILVSSRTKDIVVILDCCYPNGMKLPYRFEDNKWIMINNNFIDKNFICISSAEDTQESAVNHKGSLFTEYLFDYLKNLSIVDSHRNKNSKINSNLSSMRKFIIDRIRSNYIISNDSRSQYITIHSSLIIPYIIPSYMLIKQSIDIRYDQTKLIVTFR